MICVPVLQFKTGLLNTSVIHTHYLKKSAETLRFMLQCLTRSNWCHFLKTFPITPPGFQGTGVFSSCILAFSHMSFSSAWGTLFVPFFIWPVFHLSKHSSSIISSRKPLPTAPKSGLGPSLHAPVTALPASAVTLHPLPF